MFAFTCPNVIDLQGHTRAGNLGALIELRLGATDAQICDALAYEREGHCEALCVAAASGRSDLIAELHNWGLVRADVRALASRPLAIAAIAGHVDCLAEFRSWGLAYNDVCLPFQRSVVTEAARARQYAVLLHLRDCWSVDVDAISNEVDTIAEAIIRDDAEFVRHLSADWGFVAKPGARFARAIETFLESALMCGAMDVLTVLRTPIADGGWGFTAQDAVRSAKYVQNADVLRTLRAWGVSHQDFRADQFRLVVEIAKKHRSLEIFKALTDSEACGGFGMSRVEIGRAIFAEAIETFDRAEHLEELREIWLISSGDVADIVARTLASVLPRTERMLSMTRSDEDATMHNFILEYARNLASELAKWGATRESAESASRCPALCGFFPPANPVNAFYNDEVLARSKIFREWHATLPDFDLGLGIAGGLFGCFCAILRTELIDETCVICIEPLFVALRLEAEVSETRVRENAYAVTSCGHVLHSSCIYRLQNSGCARCPVCRAPLRGATCINSAGGELALVLLKRILSAVESARR